MAVLLKTKEEIDGIRKSCHLLYELFLRLDGYVSAGKSTLDIDRFCFDFIRKHDAVPAFLGYSGYGHTACVSMNDEVIHGIPSARRILQDGDLVKVDLGINLGGFISDSTHAYEIGAVSPAIHKLNEVTRDSLYRGISAVRDGGRVRDISKAVSDCVAPFGYGVVRDYCGHGVGLKVHEDPEVPNYIQDGPSPRLREGMVIAIEPMITERGWRVKVLPNKWTVVTLDKSVACHWEHTVAITANGPEILSEF